MSDAYCKIATNSGWTCSSTYLKASKYSWKNFPLCVGVSGLGNTILHQCLDLIQFLICNFTCHTNRRCFLECFATFRPARILWVMAVRKPLPSLLPVQNSPTQVSHWVYIFKLLWTYTLQTHFGFTTNLWTKVRSSNYSLQLQLWVAGGSSTDCSGISSDLTNDSKLLLWATKLHMNN